MTWGRLTPPPPPPSKSRVTKYPSNCRDIIREEGKVLPPPCLEPSFPPAGSRTRPPTSSASPCSSHGALCLCQSFQHLPWDLPGSVKARAGHVYDSSFDRFKRREFLTAQFCRSPVNIVPDLPSLSLACLYLEGIVSSLSLTFLGTLFFSLTDSYYRYLPRSLPDQHRQKSHRLHSHFYLHIHSSHSRWTSDHPLNPRVLLFKKTFWTETAWLSPSCSSLPSFAASSWPRLVPDWIHRAEHPHPIFQWLMSVR